MHVTNRVTQDIPGINGIRNYPPRYRVQSWVPATQSNGPDSFIFPSNYILHYFITSILSSTCMLLFQSNYLLQLGNNKGEPISNKLKMPMHPLDPNTAY